MPSPASSTSFSAEIKDRRRRARYGFTTQKDGLDEFQFGHTGGAAWDTGNLFLSYEFDHRDQLLNAHRPYSASRDFRPFGGGDYRIPYGSPGNILVPKGGIVVLHALPQGQDGRNLTRADLLEPSATSYYNYWAEATLFPRKTQYSLFSYLARDITGTIELNPEGRYTHRKISERMNSPLLEVIIPQSNPYWFDAYGTGESVRVAYSLAGSYKLESKTSVNS